jgi:hypothetical protein
MNFRHSLLAISLTALGLLSFTSPIRAFSFESPADVTGDGVFDDIDYNQKYAKGAAKTFTSKYVIESRAGNNNPEAGVWELGAFSSNYNLTGTDYTNAFVANSGRGHTWTKNALVDFMLQYTGSQLIYQIGTHQITVNVDAAKGPITDLMIRTAAGLRTDTQQPTNVSRNTSFSKVMLSQLSLGGPETAALQSVFSRSEVTAQKTRDVDYLRVKGLNNQTFTLTGKAMLDWIDAMPQNSNLGFQIKIGSTPTSVPEPGTMAALALAGAMMVKYGRRKQNAAS